MLYDLFNVLQLTVKVCWMYLKVFIYFSVLPYFIITPEANDYTVSISAYVV